MTHGKRAIGVRAIELLLYYGICGMYVEVKEIDISWQPHEVTDGHKKHRLCTGSYKKTYK